MRLFVALSPPPEALAELEVAVAPLRHDWPGLRWATQDRWHVTVAFLGEVAEPKLAELGRRLERAASRHPAQEVRIGHGGALPSARKARVLCAHIESEHGAREGLSALAASVAAGARRAGAPPPDEGRRYRPHLTLARSRQPADLAPLVAALTGFRGTIWTADQVHLVRSHAGPQPRYETLASWPMRPRSASPKRLPQ